MTVPKTMILLYSSSTVNNFSSLREITVLEAAATQKQNIFTNVSKQSSWKSKPKFHLTACQFFDVKLMNAVANKSIKPNIKTAALHPTKRKNEIQPAGQLFDPISPGSRPVSATTAAAQKYSRTPFHRGRRERSRNGKRSSQIRTNILFQLLKCYIVLNFNQKKIQPFILNYSDVQNYKDA